MNYDINFYEKFYKNNNLDILYLLKIQIENWDNDFFKIRDKKRYKVLKKRKRHMITKHGYLTYSRREYWDRLNNEHICFTDINFGIEKHKKINNEVKEIILQQHMKARSHVVIKEMIREANISIMSIHNIVKNANIQEYVPERIKVADNEIIHINVDDTYQTIRNEQGNKETAQIRVYSFNTGFDNKKSIYKAVLANKRIGFIYRDFDNFNYIKIAKKTKVSIYENYNFRENHHYIYFWKELNKYYDFEHAKLVVHGDGAKWIRTLARELHAYYVLDKWHGYKYMWDTYMPRKNKNWEYYYKAKELFNNGLHDELMEYLKQTTNNKQTLSYFKTNKQGVINQKLHFNNGSSTESDVYHLVKSISHGAKIYNYKVLENKLKLRQNYINNRY